MDRRRTQPEAAVVGRSRVRDGDIIALEWRAAAAPRNGNEERRAATRMDGPPRAAAADTRSSTSIT